MKTQYCKMLAISSFAIFLFTVLRIESLILLALTGLFAYKFFVQTINSMTQKDLLNLVPKKLKKQIEQKSLMQYVSNLQIVKTTPMLNYFVPLLNLKSKTNSSIEFSTKLKTTSAIESISNEIEYKSEVNQKRIKMVKQTIQNEENFSPEIQSINQLQPQIKNNFFSSQIKSIRLKQEPFNLTTCESNSGGANKRNSSLTGINSVKKSSGIIKRKFAQQSSSIDDNFDTDKLQHQKKMHRSNSDNRLALKNHDSGMKIQAKDFSNNGLIQPLNHQNPLKTIEQYVHALIWMMKRLLGLRKMTSKIRKASTLKITCIASILWFMIVIQIKIDSKKGKLFFKSIRAVIGILSVFSALGATLMLGFKIHKSLTEAQDQKGKQNIQSIERK